MSWVITGTQKTLNGTLTVGQELQGGYFAGYISHTANGNPTHALIVAPVATGATGTSYTLTTNLEWKTTTTTTAGTTSDFDGAANTAAMVTAGIADHPAAQFCVNLNIGGFTDWYLPARFELDIAYFNLKPSTEANNTSAGINNYSVPQRTANYTATSPAQTNLAAFNTASQAFVTGGHYSSTEANAANGWALNFSFGNIFANGKAFSSRVRAFRRIAL